MKRAAFLLLGFVALAPPIFAQTPAAGQNKPASRAPQKPPPNAAAVSAMTNQDVIKMVKAGLGEALVISSIKQAEKRAFNLTVDGLVEMKTAGVADNIIRVMMDPTSRPSDPQPAAPAPSLSEPAAVVSPPAATTPPVAEIGVYYRNGDLWSDLPPEVINWKTGGVLKHWASVGVIKGDVNGLINGPSSKTLLKSGTTILIYAPEGVAVTEYQLLRLHQKGNGREFRTVTGGVLHQEGGATRDLLPFESNKLAPRTYTVLLPNVGSGEFGILSPGAVGASSASAQLGKMYTFRIQ